MVIIMGGQQPTQMGGTSTTKGRRAIAGWIVRTSIEIQRKSASDVTARTFGSGLCLRRLKEAGRYECAKIIGVFSPAANGEKNLSYGAL